MPYELKKYIASLRRRVKQKNTAMKKPRQESLSHNRMINHNIRCVFAPLRETKKTNT